MNKKILTVSLLAVLGVAGGAYTVMNTDIMDNTELNLSQYIPESIAGLIGIDKSEAISDEVDASPSFISDEQVEADPFVEAVEQTVEDVEQAEAEVELVVETESVETEVVNEIEAEIEPQVQLPVSDTSPSSLGEENITMQIQAANSEIYKLDLENSELEMLFQKILKQNRSLAEELRELDEKIAAIN